MLDHGDVLDVYAEALERFKNEELIIAVLRDNVNGLKNFNVDEFLIKDLLRYVDVAQQLNYDNISHHAEKMEEHEKKWELQKKSK